MSAIRCKYTDPLCPCNDGDSCNHEPRVCDTCHHHLSEHMAIYGDGLIVPEGHVRPCLAPDCSCACYSDAEHRQNTAPRGRRTRNLLGVWDTPEIAVVHRNDDTGAYRFPMRADAPCPSGFSKVEIRSDAAMARVEREANVLSEKRWFDRNGRGHEKPLPPVPKIGRYGNGV